MQNKLWSQRAGVRTKKRLQSSPNIQVTAIFIVHCYEPCVIILNIFSLSVGIHTSASITYVLYKTLWFSSGYTRSLVFINNRRRKLCGLLATHINTLHRLSKIIKNSYLIFWKKTCHCNTGQWHLIPKNIPDFYVSRVHLLQ